MSDLSLTVLNANGKDKEQYFPEYAGEVDKNVHPPVNYHAYAACTAGSVQNDIDKAIELNKPVLLLIRRNMENTIQALRKLKDSGLKVAVSLKETGYHQLHAQLDKPRKLKTFKQILKLADGVVSPTQALVPIYQALRPDFKSETTHFIPTPYPVDDTRWNFARSLSERSGIFIGTRELEVSSRNHLQSLILISSLARELECPVGLINTDGNKLKNFIKILELPDGQLDVKSKMPYVEYLKFLSNYRCVFQLDQSMVPGQVAGDCSLTRQVCLGGNGAIDNILYPEFVSKTNDRSELMARVKELMTDDNYYTEVIDKANSIALEKISFSKAANDLHEFFLSI